MDPTTTATTLALPPTYKNMLEEMGRQLNQRKTALMKRVLLITWPFILLIVVGYICKSVVVFDTLSAQAKTTIYISFVVYFILSVFYTSIVRFIFKIEKQIWVDSYFDKKNLSLKESWSIAMKLFWPALFFRTKVWLRFYFLPIFAVIVICGILIRVTASFPSNYESVMIFWIITFFVLVIALIVYGYYMKTKLRYSWFIFLDKFGVENSYKIMIDEMNTLNAISKSETFKKSLLVSLGTESVDSLAKMTIGAIGFGLARFGGAGEMLGGVVRTFGEEMSKQATELGNISAQYILYRFARKEAFGNEQEVNENIYKIT